MIFNPAGKQMFSSNITEGITCLDVKNYNPGIYFVELNTKNGKSTIPLIKK